MTSFQGGSVVQVDAFTATHVLHRTEYHKFVNAQSPANI